MEPVLLPVLEQVQAPEVLPEGRQEGRQGEQREEQQVEQQEGRGEAPVVQAARAAAEIPLQTVFLLCRLQDNHPAHPGNLLHPRPPSHRINHSNQHRHPHVPLKDIRVWIVSGNLCVRPARTQDPVMPAHNPVKHLRLSHSIAMALPVRPAP